ncbi:MAG: hypothetical protein ACM34I_01655 [bacterium]
MSESLFSPSWYRVSRLQPTLRRHAQIHRHFYGGELWYVLQDHATGRFFRFTPMVYHMVGLMDGKLTVQELWEKTVERFGDDAPTQSDIVRVLSQLHSADVLICDVPPDTAELFRRHEKVEMSKLKMNLRSPLALRFPLLDPEKFLSRSLNLVRPLFSVYGAVLWLVVVATALVLAVQHWSELTKNMSDRVLSAQNLLLMWFIYPVIKSLHELGHGYAVKRWGGEVHEMGIMLLVLMPVPYVDASSSSAFRDKKQRMLVGAAGIMVELFVASLALFFWLNLEQGILRSLAYNAVLIASVSTVLFNGNPLLRYDGYYIFADLVEIPNLSQKSLEYLGYLAKRYLFGLKKTEPPHAGQGKRFWLFSYSVASFIYRLFIYAAIILFISGKFFIVGLVLGIWALTSMVVVPAVKKIHFILSSPVLHEKRVRSLGISGALLLGVLMIIFLMPFPLWTRTEGIIWVPEDSLVRAGTAGFVTTVKALPNKPVKRGDIVIECRDPLLTASVKVLRARLKSIEARYDAEIYTDRVKAEITTEEIAQIRADLKRAEERFEELTIRSLNEGVLIIPGAEDLPDRFLKQGDLVAYVLDADNPTVRVVIPQSDVDLIRKRTNGVEIRLAERIDHVIPAAVMREIPGGVESLPSTVLGSSGGGTVAIDPRDPKGLKALEKMFQFDITLAAPVEQVNVGGRVYVRFDHGYEPLAFRWYRSIRRLFLRRFNV